VVNERIQNLLVLQDRFQNSEKLKNELARLPAEIEKLRDQIKEETDQFESASNEVKALETKRSQIDLEVKSAEEQILKYRGQQLLVKKNDEYQALTHEIELTEQKISDLETEELELMESIDEETVLLKKTKEETEKRIAYQKQLISDCEAKIANLSAEKDSAVSIFEKHLSETPLEDARIFERLQKQVKRAPMIVEVKDQQCGGCHMRVSNDSFKKAKIGEIAFCDQCSRLLYFDT